MRVLIVDDDAAIRDLLIQVLHDDAGYQVAEAGNGAEALAALPAFRPDVVILDLLMPVKDGFAVLRALRENPERPRVIVLSAIANLHEAAYAHELGADAVLGKPFDIDELLHAVERRAVAR